MSLSLCVCVCPSISGHSARTAGPISAGVAPMDAPERRNDIGAGRGSAGGTWHVPPRKGLPNFFEQPYRSHGGNHRSETHRSHAYCTNLKSIGGAVPVGCQLHAPGAKKLF